MFVLLVVGLVDLWELPGEDKPLSFRLVRPAVPLVGALVKDVDDLVEELETFFLQSLLYDYKVLEFDNAEDDVQTVAWDHDL